MATDDEKRDHGLRLKVAMSRARVDRQRIADATGVKPRTVTNWTSGKTMPTEAEKTVLRNLFGDYDNPGDPVEVAIDRSELHDWRRDRVKSEYKRQLQEQRREETA